MSRPLRSGLLLALGAVALMVEGACARSVSEDASGDPLLAPGAVLPGPLAACVATECPAPWASCADGLCTTDTSRDVENCGACDHACPKPLNASPLCSGGACAFACKALYADCNQKAVDGCEVSTGDDPKNCGGCGHTCKEGEICWRGACGCPSAFATCGTECKNLQTDDEACGACDAACKPPPWSDDRWTCGPGVQPPQTGWGCIGGACHIVCKGAYEDCNGKICEDGCEVDTRSDAANCGACGHACGAGQECVQGACLCPPGSTRCGDRCVDTAVDVDNCGGCGKPCPGANDLSSNGTPTCAGGTCGYLCYQGFADCNRRVNDGCEVEVGKDPRNCGGCGTSCDVARGQPCVEGKCLTKACDPSAPTR